MEKIILEDGTEREVPTQEELEAFQAASTKATELEASLATKEKEWEEKQKQLEESIDPNWKAAREKMDRLEKLEKLGKTINENGEISELNPKIDPNEIIKKATEESKKEVLNSFLSEKKNKLLSTIPEEKRGDVELYFDKLTNGEVVNLENIESFFASATSLVFPQQANEIKDINPNGRIPSFQKPESKGFGDTPEGQNVANEIWGSGSFAFNQNK